MNMRDKHVYASGVLLMKVFSAYHAAMRIAAIRRQRGLTQEELANTVDVTQATISRIEGGSDSVSLHLLRKIAAALDCEIADFFLDDRSAKEQALIDAFRSVSPDRQQGWIDLASSLVAKPSRHAG